MINVPIDRIIPMSDARDNFSKIVAEIEHQKDGMYVLTKAGKPAVALVNIQYLSSVIDPNGQTPAIKPKQKPNLDEGKPMLQPPVQVQVSPSKAPEPEIRPVLPSKAPEPESTPVAPKPKIDPSWLEDSDQDLTEDKPDSSPAPKSVGAWPLSPPMASPSPVSSPPLTPSAASPPATSSSFPSSAPSPASPNPFSSAIPPVRPPIPPPPSFASASTTDLSGTSSNPFASKGSSVSVNPFGDGDSSSSSSQTAPLNQPVGTTSPPITTAASSDQAPISRSDARSDEPPAAPIAPPPPVRPSIPPPPPPMTTSPSFPPATTSPNSAMPPARPPIPPPPSFASSSPYSPPQLPSSSAAPEVKIPVTTPPPNPVTIPFDEPPKTNIEPGEPAPLPKQPAQPGPTQKTDPNSPSVPPIPPQSIRDVEI